MISMRNKMFYFALLLICSGAVAGTDGVEPIYIFSLDGRSLTRADTRSNEAMARRYEVIIKSMEAEARAKGNREEAEARANGNKKEADVWAKSVEAWDKSAEAWAKGNEKEARASYNEAVVLGNEALGNEALAKADSKEACSKLL